MIKPSETCHMSQFFWELLTPSWKACVAFLIYGDVVLYTVLIAA